MTDETQRQQNPDEARRQQQNSEETQRRQDPEKTQRQQDPDAAQRQVPDEGLRQQNSDAAQRQQILDEALLRLHTTGPEFDDWLSNHAPMAVEALAHHGHADRVHHWIDEYEHVLEEAPRPSDPITVENWREALGDPRRLGDWPSWFDNELAEAEWTEVLARWWPRLLPGIVASATHGVIRVGHAVRTLREQGPNEARLAELARAFGYWAARWQPMVRPTAPSGGLDAASALARVPRIPEQDGGIRDRLAQLDGLAGWESAQAALRLPGEAEAVPDAVRAIVTAAVNRYLSHGHGSAVMLVHAATAPNAVLRVLPSLPREHWHDSAAFAWSASAAVMSIYAPAEAAPTTELPQAPDGSGAEEEIFDAAAANGDAHVIKFADTALDVRSWTGDATPLAAALRSAQLIGD
ncbi:questin oxidase family protein [Stackebrandtia nassauensis]|uniref:DUF4243 domain-containing protein n=1 Tax=Stackebrandtia nassauensis (strain DSM 44728 / CIP 108903 / NRRL B-16338 / NBRC 102104 / LLR-40K-21) TaxID=446470 RepID=D3QBY5_STANL|nr:questin oxidase family protein [Stackebrandtia nassauensis]ADD44874.1 hypothetical protein Snas_5240 [Stackebrandtia nassauensis DSM 44728]